jgi:GMP synthase PP-ATPase subunit
MTTLSKRKVKHHNVVDIPKETKQPIIQPLEEARHGWRMLLDEHSKVVDGFNRRKSATGELEVICPKGS